MTYHHNHSTLFRSRKRIKSGWNNRWVKPINWNPLLIMMARIAR